MKKITILMLGPIFVAGCQQAGTGMPGYASYGAAVETRHVMALSDAIERLDDNPGHTVAVKARIDSVCKKRGCWMLLADGDHRVRVRFTASAQCTDGFLVPRNADGHDAVVRGVLKRDVMSQDMARHYAEDAGKSAEEIAKIVGEQPAVTMIATGVMISEGDRLDPPVQ